MVDIVFEVGYSCGKCAKVPAGVLGNAVSQSKNLVVLKTNDSGRTYMLSVIFEVEPVIRHEMNQLGPRRM